ncbi:hypothetical protein DPMN_098433 [Dreissena polymorpha]|uniref:Uncharacterized protein n=1 Tax=Dreissena polymorpha TaxID=45954 RepID=A0A9D4LCB6_DREPO|nr:hypothetical protein DPMN_098433 [Dreissena polymorpha]
MLQHILSCYISFKPSEGEDEGSPTNDQQSPKKNSGNSNNQQKELPSNNKREEAPRSRINRHHERTMTLNSAGVI